MCERIHLNDKNIVEGLTGVDVVHRILVKNNAYDSNSV